MSEPFIRAPALPPGFFDLPVDWRTICTTGPSTADVTMESLQETLRQFNALPKPEYDALVFLRPTWAAFRRNAAGLFVEDGFSHDRIAGIPVYVYDSEAELAVEVQNLRSVRRSIGVVMADGSIVKVEGR